MAWSGLVFAQAPAPALLCPLCSMLLVDPVIATVCGHSFCRACASTAGATCHSDGRVLLCDAHTTTALVPNLVLESQVHDLLVYCRHARFSPSKTVASSQHADAVDLDPTGCSMTVRLGELLQHEAVCPHAMVPCNYNLACGLFLRSQLGRHLSGCPRVACSNKVLSSPALPLFCFCFFEGLALNEA